MKNPNGADSPETAIKAMSDLHKKWLQNAGYIVQGEGVVEVSPRVSYAGEGILKVENKILQTPVHFVSN